MSNSEDAPIYQDTAIPNNMCPSKAVVVQPIGVNLDTQPCSLICPVCKANVVSKITHKSGLCTWLLCVLLCLVGCGFGCQFIPFCVDRCKDVQHHCPNCNSFLGKKKPI
ncbi:lipopolysaccharide-induced tumor necrosis factor-alpha factor [Brachionus plicatilis]|uniref:Lipopolysaccharide-induced tumor necrosis factor-alpha factor n=1 Tax=Brachionus plicatilis TaxID=10195 RepID=A0A3M7Q8K3_BRAPC|nr:lipopolysaccharide-induced tumor necrosis factor-alpha factor [Brachionus plicatilis]